MCIIVTTKKNVSLTVSFFKEKNECFSSFPSTFDGSVTMYTIFLQNLYSTKKIILKKQNKYSLHDTEVCFPRYFKLRAYYFTRAEDIILEIEKNKTGGFHREEDRREDKKKRKERLNPTRKSDENSR